MKDAKSAALEQALSVLRPEHFGTDLVVKCVLNAKGKAWTKNDLQAMARAQIAGAIADGLLSESESVGGSDPDAVPNSARILQVVANRRIGAECQGLLRGRPPAVRTITATATATDE
jgi:hypothetical protein